MKVIAHQAPGVELRVGFLAGFVEGFHEELLIALVHKDCFPAFPRRLREARRLSTVIAFGVKISCSDPAPLRPTLPRSDPARIFRW